MKKLLILLSILGLGFLALFFSAKAKADSDNLKVTICHYDEGQGGKYTSNDVSINSVAKCESVNGHDGHSNDIIPAFSFDTCNYPGKNLDKVSWIDNGCAAPVEHHHACVDNACTLVDGAGSDTCTTDSNCGETAKHYSCVENSCSLVDGSGTDSCSPNDKNACKPTITDTPTPTPSNPGGPGDGRSDGLSSCPSCTQAPQGQVLGASTQAVLGLSTTSGESNIYFNLVQLFAALGLTATGFKFFRKNA